MPVAKLPDVELYYEVHGEGVPLVWCHPFGDDHRCWELQVRHFGRLYKCIAYNHRGYPPSSQPPNQDDYSPQILLKDLVGLLDHLEIDRAHFVGISMGGAVVRSLAQRHPERCISAVVAGAGTGSEDPEEHKRIIEEAVAVIHNSGMEAFASYYLDNVSHRTLQRKDPLGWEQFRARFAANNPDFVVNSQRGIRGYRAPVAARAGALAEMKVPLLLLVGDHDEAALEPMLAAYRAIPIASLGVLPNSGHPINIEEPALFNSMVETFLRRVESGAWHASLE